MKYKIYKLIDPLNFEVKYIGITTGTLIKRLVGHINQLYRKEKYSDKGDWIEGLIKIGRCPIIEFIEEVDSETKKERERYWVNYYKDDYILYNIQYNNSQLLAKDVSARKAIKIYEYTLGGDFVKEWYSVTEASIFYNLDSGNICYAANGKRKCSGDKMWRYYKKDKIPNYVKAKSRKTVHQYTLEGEYLKSYDSARYIDGFSYKKISAVCTGKINTTGGFRFSFEKVDVLPPILDKRFKTTPTSRFYKEEPSNSQTKKVA